MKIQIISEKDHAHCELGNVKITDENSWGGDCEYCNNIGPFKATISDGDRWWCIDCFISGDMGSITRTNQEEIQLECLKREKKYIKKRYDQLFKSSDNKKILYIDNEPFNSWIDVLNYLLKE